eukprot:4074142-Pyramimonas_sp.AAC.1
MLRKHGGRACHGHVDNGMVLAGRIVWPHPSQNDTRTCAVTNENNKPARSGLAASRATKSTMHAFERTPFESEPLLSLIHI